MQKPQAAIHKKHLASACAAHRYPVTLSRRKKKENDENGLGRATISQQRNEILDI